MNRNLIVIMGVLGLLGATAAFVVARTLNHAESETQTEPSIPALLAQTPWATPEATTRIARLERLRASSSLDADDAHFLLESLAKEIPSVDPSQRDIPIAESPQAQRWFLVNHEVVTARGVAVKALREEWAMPKHVHDSVEHELLSLLDSDEPGARLAGVSLVVSSRMIENPAYRARIEAVRLGDDDASVRANAERQLAHYAYLYEGGPTADRPEECNTCP